MTCPGTTIICPSGSIRGLVADQGWLHSHDGLPDVLLNDNLPRIDSTVQESLHTMQAKVRLTVPFWELSIPPMKLLGLNLDTHESRHGSVPSAYVSIKQGRL